MADKPDGWIEDLEIADANIKWAFSHFDGRLDTFNDEGDHNFVVIIPEEDAQRLAAVGWAVKEKDPLEEGDPPEFHLKCKISYRFEDPKIYLIKGERKFRAAEEDLGDINRATCERVDVILSPSRWSRPDGTSGVTAYTKELYAVVRESRFAAQYSEYEEVR